MTLRRILRRTPWPVRRRMFQTAQRRILPRTAPERRLRIARALMPLGRARRDRAAAPGRLMRVRTRHGRLGARVVTTTSPVEVRRANLDRVAEALEMAGVDWFRVPSADPGRTTVGVPESERGLMLGLLTGIARRDHGMLRAAGPPGRHDRVVAACWPVTDPGGNLVLGPEYACEVEFWRPEGHALLAPRPNPVATTVPAAEPVTAAAEPVFGAFSEPDDATAYRTRRVFTALGPERIDFPVDVVYTWVDGADPAWQRRRARALAQNPWVARVNRQAANDSRWINRDELRYSMRALHCFAPWVRHVHLVTDDQVPAWLDLSHPRLTVVTHREIFGDGGRLPTFNSQAIESRLHRIPGLAEHFLYLNDDVFLGRPVTPDLFFTPGGLTRFFPSSSLVDPAPRGPGDRPADAAAKNNRRLIRETFGRVLSRKMMHTPHPARRSVLLEIEERFAEAVRGTAGHQFRHPEDVSMLSSLQQYYAYLTGRATPGQIRYRYTELADPVTPLRLARPLRTRGVDAFCLNDVDAADAVRAEQQALLADFLPAYLPFASPFELRLPRGGTVSPAALAALPRRPGPRRPATAPAALPPVA
ncbi:stealth family protein [Actinoplanes teichomyceticus]|uniref:stealth family protein n=1 Tax=Actinoplanes teichomyceticus TaxID=1867 RepID=UPI000F0A3A51|nr:stealth family protein [Actinoplanes teichomyceticus]GIF10464.1 exopolysaccharide phosphotransferase [Actinoplanes teichomyceticus]